MSDHASEAFSQNLHYISGFSHRIEMDCRNAVTDQLLALHGTPFGADIIDGLPVISGLRYLLRKLQRNVYRE